MHASFGQSDVSDVPVAGLAIWVPTATRTLDDGTYRVAGMVGETVYINYVIATFS